MADASLRSILAALAGNLAVAAVKLAAYFISGSGAMLVETFHSIVDTLNSGLLLVGLRLSARPPDRLHNFGHGLDSFFWTFVVGVLIFVAGGVASLYEGIEKLRHPQPLGHVPVMLAVLALSFVFETLSFLASWRESERGRPQLSRRRYKRVTLVQFVHLSPDPGVFEVLAEGTASLLGLIIAAAGVIASALFGYAWADGVAALSIGILLIALGAIILAESKSLLTGEAVPAVILEAVREIMSADSRVARVGEIMSMYLGPDEILLAPAIHFTDNVSIRDIRQVTDTILTQLHQIEPRINRLFLRVDATDAGSTRYQAATQTPSRQ